MELKIFLPRNVGEMIITESTNSDLDLNLLVYANEVTGTKVLTNVKFRMERKQVELILKMFPVGET